MPGNWDSITALLVVFLPNLSTFRLPSGHEYVGDDVIEFMPYIFSRAMKLQNSGIYTQQSLSKLRNFEISVGDFYPSLS